jgi:hypothetical protein
MAYEQAMQNFFGVVQEFSLARSLEKITDMVRIAARDLTGTDGATFVLREGDNCSIRTGKRYPTTVETAPRFT